MPEFKRPSRRGHWEAVRLEWLSRHVPVGTVLIGVIAAVILASAVFAILAQSPSNPIP
jgi:hypothetical protein